MPTFTNSPLVNYTRISPNKNETRTHDEFNPRGVINKITIHHMAGNLSVETCGNIFASEARQASANYGIGSDGRVGLYVDEAHRAWTSGSPANDYRAVTIEVANDQVGGNWHVSDKALNKLIELCVDICRRNHIQKLDYTGDANGDLTMHKFFQATTCPGPYLTSKMQYIADTVNARLAVLYRVRKSWRNALSQVGAFTVLENAKAACDKAGAGYYVFDASGKAIYPSTPAPTPAPKPTSATKPNVAVGGGFNLGDEVKLVAGAKYTSGGTIPGWLFNKKLYVRDINGNNIVFSTLKTGAVTGVVDKSYLVRYSSAPAVAQPVAPKPVAPVVTSTDFKVGDKVRMQNGAPIYGQTYGFQGWVYNSTLYVREINGNRVVVSTVKTGATTGAVDKKYLTKA